MQSCQTVPYSLYFQSLLSQRQQDSLRLVHGIGNEEALEVLRKVKERFHVPITTDIHTPEEAQVAVESGVDIIQIPAFLCRQTTLLQAAAQTGKKINVKKGQFLAPETNGFCCREVGAIWCYKRIHSDYRKRHAVWIQRFGGGYAQHTPYATVWAFPW